MPAKHDVQAQRYEVKYLVPASLRYPIRDFLAAHLELDAFARQSADCAYAIHSIYLDSPALHTHQATQNDDRNRFKLRMRYYDDRPESPLFLEVKQRCDDVIKKTRCMVARPDLERVLSGDTSSLREKDLAGYAQFTHLAREIQAAPCAYVTYRREAWVSPFDNSVRVTMDSDVLVEPKFDLVPQTAPVYPVRPFGGELILEFKYTARYPDWLRSLVRSFDLTRTGVPKYSAGVKSYGVPRFMERPASSLQWRGECAAPA